MVSLVAPAGYGKSTLLAQWAASDDRPCAWLSLDGRDNDPIVLLSHLTGALDRLEPVNKLLLRALRTPGASIFGTVVPRLGAELRARTEPVILIMDDIHEIEEPVCLDALAVLSRHLTDGSLLVLSGRKVPALPLARYRSEGLLLEFDAASLSLDEAEAGELLRDTGVELSDFEVGDLNRHAEGWAAGLYLAALALLAADGPPDVSRFTGDDRFVTDYLRAELLGSIPLAEMEFLTRTSVLERLSAPLCDAILGSASSAEHLEVLERNNLMLVPLDHSRVWYRYHHLFRDMLRAELERREPELIPHLHLRAAAWCEENGEADSAVTHAAAAADLDKVGDLVARFGIPTYRAGRSTTVARWLGLIDDPATLGRSAGAALVGANFHAIEGHTDEAVRWLDAIPPAARKNVAVQRGIASAEALMCRNGVEAMLRDAEFGAGTGDPIRANNLHVIGAAHLLRGDEETAERIFAEAVYLARRANASSIAIFALAERALLALTRGDVDAADALVAEARSWIDDVGSDGYTPSALLYATAARAAIRRSDISQARTELVAAHRLRPQLTASIPWFSVQVRVEMARGHLALAERDAALTVLSEARAILHIRPDLGVLGAQVSDLTTQVTSFDDPVAVAWASSLTVAELRVLPLLTTHLTFREIADRLSLSRNTIKTQAISLYRKLGVSSRSEAVARAVELGLVDR